MKRKLALAKSSSLPAKGGAKALLADVRGLILEARQIVARGVNAALVVLYWNIGQRIRRDILKEKRAEYGEQMSPRWGDNWNGSLGAAMAKKWIRLFIRRQEDGGIQGVLWTKWGKVCS